MKRVLEIKEIEPRILKVKIEATKRRTIWLRLLRKSVPNPCSGYCPFARHLYVAGKIKKSCHEMESPLKKYQTLFEFCIYLKSEYLDLVQQLEGGWEIYDFSGQVVMYKKEKRKP